MTYLCHKCGGKLTDCNDPAIYSCTCISGYVRDFQAPTPDSDLRATQIRYVREWLELYDRQKRPANDTQRVLRMAQLAALERTT